MELRQRLRHRVRRFRLGTANIRKNMRQARIHADAVKMARESDVLCLQEIKDRSNLEAVKRALGPAFRLRHQHLPIPIAYRWAKFKRLEQGWAKLHDGSEEVPNPDRYVSWVVLRRRFLPWAKPIVIMNTHWVNGAWNEKRDHVAWRQEKWWLDWEGCRDLVGDFLSRGFTVFLNGDLNKLKVDPFTPKWRWHWNRGIVKVGGVEGEQAYSVVGAQAVKLWSDHDGRVLDIRLERL